MRVRIAKYGFVWTVALVLLLVACSPFGGKDKPTDTPEAAETPEKVALPATATVTSVPDLVTPTPTAPQAMATPTPTLTATPVPTQELRPTLTPTGAPDSGTPTPSGDSGATPAAGSGTAVVVEMGSVVRNGSFEEGFDAQGVGLDWTAFSTTDGAVYAWEGDSDPMHVSHGEYAQVIRIMGPGEPNRFAGIYQTFDVVPGETYTLALHGVIRSSLANENYDPLAYRIQWAVDEQGGTDWEGIEWAEWTDPGWNDVQLDVKWPPMDAYVQQITPQGKKATLYIRGWSKWGFFQSEGEFYLDGIYVQGPLPDGAKMPTTGGNVVWVPILGLLLVLGFALWEVRRGRAL